MIKRIFPLCNLKEGFFIKRAVGIGLVVFSILAFNPLHLKAQDFCAITDIQIRGNQHIKESKIKKVIKSKADESFSEAKIKEDMQAIYDMGYFSRVKVFREDVKEGLILIFKVKENEEIAQIEFKGREENIRKVKKLITFKPGDLWNFKKVREARERILKFFLKRGFFLASVDIFRERLEENRCKAVIEFEPGKNFFISEVKIEGNKILPREKIAGELKIKRNKLFIPDQLDKGIDRVRDLYEERGYIYARIESDLKIDEEKGRVKVIIDIEENTLARVGEITLEGENISSKERILKHTFIVKKGDIFNIKKIRESWRRTYNLGFFEKVEIKPVPTSSPAIVDLVVEVKEIERKGKLLLGVGYSANSGWQGNIQISKDNLWGEGKKIGVDWEFGKDKSNYDVDYLDRWWQDTSTSVRINLYNKERRYEDYEKEERGGKLSLGFPAGRYTQLFLNFKNENVEVTQKGDSLPEGLEEGIKLGRSLGFKWQKDTRVRDEAFNSYKGSYTSLSLEESGGCLGGDIDFVSYGAEWRGYFRKGSLWNFPILACRLQGKLGEDLPYTEKFSVGGQHSLRGYEYGEFEGDKLLLGNLELRFPLSKDFMALLFVDSGRMWNEDSGMKFFKTGWGLGVKIRSPLGPIRMDYGIREDKKGKFYFGIGEGF
ncbi:MAG: BamA/TamA family outer membrane protein [Candidatus Aerophobetes bacterium]|nr:BamA/TamA family outer membrane protein [Candidatus Aerophobetes bacterium]